MYSQPISCCVVLLSFELQFHPYQRHMILIKSIYQVPHCIFHKELFQNFYPRITSSTKNMYPRALAKFFIKKTVCRVLWLVMNVYVIVMLWHLKHADTVFMHMCVVYCIACWFIVVNSLSLNDWLLLNFFQNFALVRSIHIQIEIFWQIPEVIMSIMHKF